MNLMICGVGRGCRHADGDPERMVGRTYRRPDCSVLLDVDTRMISLQFGNCCDSLLIAYVSQIGKNESLSIESVQLIEGMGVHMMTEASST